MKDISLKAKVSVFIAIFFWASAFVGIRAGLQGYSPGGLALLRFLIASTCMLIIYLRLPQREKMPAKQALLMLLMGAIGVGGYNIALNFGEMTVSSGIASFIISQSPILTSIFAFLFLGEKLKKLALLGMFISFIGVSLILVSTNETFHFRTGMLYVFGAMFFSGIYSISQKPFLTKFHALEVAVYTIWGGTLALLFFIPDLLHDLKTAPLSATYATIYLGIFPAAIAYAAWNYALAEMSVSRVVNFLYFMPLIATLLGWLWLNEVPAWLGLLGGMIALLGVMLVNKSFVNSKKTA